MKVPSIDWYDDAPPSPSLVRAETWFREIVPNYRTLAPEEFKSVPGAQYGETYETLTINTPHYLEWLKARVERLGAKVVRSTIKSFHEVLEKVGQKDEDGEGKQDNILVVALGLGAAKLPGLEDKSVYPTRGQTILVDAPRVKRTCAHLQRDGAVSYIIPRSNGQVILGGCNEKGDWYTGIRPEMSKFIAQSCIALDGNLVEEKGVGGGEKDPLRLLKIVRQNCGLRPSRHGGIRLEAEWRDTQGAGHRVLTGYCYGHGGTGYQSSWGSCRALVDVLESKLRRDM